jgi:hypothetical protein
LTRNYFKISIIYAEIVLFMVSFHLFTAGWLDMRAYCLSLLAFKTSFFLTRFKNDKGRVIVSAGYVVSGKGFYDERGHHH